MDIDNIIKAVSHHPAIVFSFIEIEPSEREEIVRNEIALVATDVAVSHDWDFNTHFIDMTSALDQAVYECEGNKNDCRDIITVQYGGTSSDDSFTVLKELSPVDRDDYVAKLGVSDVTFWSPYKRSDNDYPRFELVGAPTASGNVIRVRYRLKDIGIGSFPDEFESVLRWGVMAALLPEFEPKYQDFLGQMVVRHQGAGREDKRMPLDPIIEQRNMDRFNLPGY